MLLGGVEAGGTKVVVGTGSGPAELRARAVIPTTSPDETIAAIIEWFAGQPPIAALGIGSFGPIGLTGEEWGRIGRTPKPGWAGTPLGPRLAAALGTPVGLDTDVNAAALAEGRWGSGLGCRSLVYVTVGTGIGGGVVIDGRTIRGRSHPEMGHVPVRRHPEDEGFPGICPAHGACLEGLASGPAVRRRWGDELSQLPPGHPGPRIIADYLGQLVINLQAILSPERIVLGGGVMKTPRLLEMVATSAAELGNGYFASEPAQLLAPPGLGDNSGLLGAFALAEQALGG